jgi:hypothetical protein
VVDGVLPDGRMLVTERAQSLNDHAGSVLRLHDDGRIPLDNPYANKDGAKPEKWILTGASDGALLRLEPTSF